MAVDLRNWRRLMECPFAGLAPADFGDVAGRGISDFIFGIFRSLFDRQFVRPTLIVSIVLNSGAHYQIPASMTIAG
jgi:hypothetical protein